MTVAASHTFFEDTKLNDLVTSPAMTLTARSRNCCRSA